MYVQYDEGGNFTVSLSYQRWAVQARQQGRKACASCNEPLPSDRVHLPTCGVCAALDAATARRTALELCLNSPCHRSEVAYDDPSELAELAMAHHRRERVRGPVFGDNPEE